MTRTRPEHAGPPEVTRGPRRWISLLGGVAVFLTLAACTAPLPEITFYGNRTAVTTEPTRWCSVNVTVTEQRVACTDTAADQTSRLTLGPGQPVQINVPAAVGDQPWAVYFRYRDATGTLQDGRSEIFSDGRLAYTLRPLRDDDQLVYVEVRSGFELTPGANGGVDFASSQGWLLLIEPKSAPRPASG